MKYTLSMIRLKIVHALRLSNISSCGFQHVQTALNFVIVQWCHKQEYRESIFEAAKRTLAPNSEPAIKINF